MCLEFKGGNNDEHKQLVACFIPVNTKGQRFVRQWKQMISCINSAMGQKTPSTGMAEHNLSATGTCRDQTIQKLERFQKLRLSLYDISFLIIISHFQLAFSLYFWFFCFELWSLYPRIPLNSLSYCFKLTSTKIAGKYHYVFLLLVILYTEFLESEI